MKKLFATLFVITAVLTAGAQKKSPVVLKIQKQNFTLDEFEYVFTKNNQLSQTPLSSSEYLDLFVNYKLKVTEAKALGFDTTETFKREFAYYRDELAKPYLNDKKEEEKLALEAYDRLKWEVDASHILIRFPQMPTPADTLKAWQSITEIAEKAKKGESFETLAETYSEDPSAKQNKGRLGYFTGFQMVYPFENTAFNTPVGHLSNIVRSSFGYHLLKIHDKRPSSGEILTAHIMKMFQMGAPESEQLKAKQSIDSLYQLILAGADFGQLARENSDDRNSAINNGEMPWFNTGRMIPEFAQPAFALTQNGQISKPIKTPYGWHIIKRLDHRGVAAYDDIKEEIYQRIGQDERAYAGQNAVLKKLKSDYKFQVIKDGLTPLKKIISEEAMTDSLFFVKASTLKQPVVTFAKTKLTQNQFVSYLKSQPSFSVARGEAELDNQFEAFCNEKLLDYEKNVLKDKEPEYRFLVTEYHDGLLIFEISQQEIWNKAASDTTGLDNYFLANRNNYPKPEQWEGVIYYCNNQETADKLRSVLSPDAATNDSIISGFGLSVSEVKTEKGKFFKGDNALIDNNFFKSEATKQVIYPSGFTTAITIGNIKPATLFELDEIKGQVLSDYQNELEKIWVKSLKAKYAPKVNYKLVKNMKANTVN